RFIGSSRHRHRGLPPAITSAGQTSQIRDRSLMAQAFAGGVDHGAAWRCLRRFPDHVIVVNRRDITDEEKEASLQAPPIIMFDAAGNVVSSMGDPASVANSIHGCSVDHENNIWVGGNGDGIIQKYSHEGKLLLQIGKRGVFDTTDGTSKGKALNSNPAQFFNPAGAVVDPNNGDI